VEAHVGPFAEVGRCHLLRSVAELAGPPQ
jgi:hypothetical protein